MGDMNLVPMAELSNWLPGELTLDSTLGGWSDIALRGYRYPGLEVEVPAMEGYTLAIFRSAAADLGRLSGARWRSSPVQPGDITILTRAEESRWRWDSPIEVTHIYLSHAAISEVAAEIFDQEVDHIRIEHTLRVQDPLLSRIVQTLEDEVITGGELLIDTVRTQLCIHLLRHYANVRFKDENSGRQVATFKRKQIVRFVDDNLHRNFTLNELCILTRSSASQLIRIFHNEFGCPPHVYTLRRRIARAQALMTSDKAIPLKAVAADCGFSDQSHMSRVFRKLIHETPAAYRARCSNKHQRCGSAVSPLMVGPANS
jgi:AraC family transcriptional regulator